jgi:hypothetical protein
MGNCLCNSHKISGDNLNNLPNIKITNNEKHNDKNLIKEYFIIERVLIDGVYIGIVYNEPNKYNKPNEPINNQAIRINEFGNDIRRLITCSGDDNKLIYNFEKNTILTLYKENGIIMICLESNLNLILTYFGIYALKSFKPIGIKELSDDLDKIFWFIRNN